MFVGLLFKGALLHAVLTWHCTVKVASYMNVVCHCVVYVSFALHELDYERATKFQNFPFKSQMPQDVRRVVVCHHSIVSGCCYI